MHQAVFLRASHKSIQSSQQPFIILCIVGLRSGGMEIICAVGIRMKCGFEPRLPESDMSVLCLILLTELLTIAVLSALSVKRLISVSQQAAWV